jgi:hypothetical protein
MDMVHAGLAYLATTDASAMGAAERAGWLRGLEEADAVATVARTSVLGAFAAGQDYVDDGDYSPCGWLIHRTHVTKGTAVDHTGWMKRGAGHPAVMAALAARKVSKSYAREICWWTDKLPEDSRAAADEILLGAAGSGLALADLAGLAGEMFERSRQDKPDGEGPDGGGPDGDDPDRDRDGVLGDRSVTLATTIGGAGVLRGALSPECAEFVQAVLDSLSGPAGADDGRSHEQRYHDGLQEAMRRLIAAGLVPERAGAAVNVLAYVPLADLILIEGSSALLAQWTSGLRARWAGHRAAAEAAGGHQGLWLDGDAAQGIACDASVTPVVAGDVNAAAFGDLVRLCVQLDRLGRHGTADGTQAGEGEDGRGTASGADDSAPADGSAGADGSAPDAGAAFGGRRSRAALVQAIIGQAVALLSGPGGLASLLRREQLDTRLAGPSLPLDIGYSTTIPAHIRKTVRLRARGHCEWAGGCSQPAGACQVHHVTHKANGGKTSLTGCVLLCFFHHQVMIHRRGWTLVVNPDGTTMAWNKDKTKVLHSHGPPARAG